MSVDYGEFMRLLKTLRDARDAVRAVKRERKRYPDGVEALLTKPQYAAMEKAERELNEELSES